MMLRGAPNNGLQRRGDDFDIAGVRAVVAQRTAGRLKRDAVLSAAPFADDAAWMNAFGRRVSGRAAIEQFFNKLYADAGYQAGTNVEESEPEITFLRPDVGTLARPRRHN